MIVSTFTAQLSVANVKLAAALAKISHIFMLQPISPTAVTVPGISSVTGPLDNKKKILIP